MQNNTNNNNNSKKMNNTPVYKTFCKVCQDSGKLVSDYTNHNVRDRFGKTTCPTLLAQECRNCFGRGHTIKYCHLLKGIKMEPVTKTRDPVTKTMDPVTKTKQMSKNVFMVFDDDSEEDEPIKQEDEPIKQEDTEFPTLIAAPVAIQKPVLNYGKILSQENNPETCVEGKEMHEKAKKYIEDREAKRQQTLVDRVANIGKPFCWAAAESDSEGDETDDEEVAPKKVMQRRFVDNSAW